MYISEERAKKLMLLCIPYMLDTVTNIVCNHYFNLEENKYRLILLRLSVCYYIVLSNYCIVTSIVLTIIQVLLVLVLIFILLSHIRTFNESAKNVKYIFNIFL